MTENKKNPPTSNRGVNPQSSKTSGDGEGRAHHTLIDWLTFSFPKDDIWVLFDGKTDDRHWHKQICRAISGLETEFVARKGLHGYNTAYENASGVVVAWGMPLQANGAYVSYPGEALNDINALDIARHCLDLGGRCTRLDIASDSTGYDCAPSYLYKLISAGGADTRAQKWRLVQSNQGDTLYIGSRVSERFLRLYEKGKKEGGNPDWLRCELELKGRAATGTLLYLLDMGLEDIPAVITAFCDFHDNEWGTWMQSDAVVEIASEKRRSNTREWLLTAVPKSLAGEIAKDPAFFGEFMTAVEHNIPEDAIKKIWGVI